MRIGEVAERIAINPKAIRYESIGLIPNPPEPKRATGTTRTKTWRESDSSRQPDAST